MLPSRALQPSGKFACVWIPFELAAGRIGHALRNPRRRKAGAVQQRALAQILNVNRMIRRNRIDLSASGKTALAFRQWRCRRRSRDGICA